MGALRNYLPIECYCSEALMNKIVKAITMHIHDSHVNDISDFDDSFSNVRVCVDFEPYMDKLEIKAAEVLDSEWDLLYGDSAVLTSRLRAVLKDHNRGQKELHRQASDFMQERYA
ncbi:MAG: hypothetical protein ACK5KT_11470 [Dysgonomonas sp.]